jgi:hypothetical protein
VSDYDFGTWDRDSSSWHYPQDDLVTPLWSSICSDPQPSFTINRRPAYLPVQSPSPPVAPLSPPCPPLSPLGLNIAPLAQIIEQVASPQAPQAFMSPLVHLATLPPMPSSPIIEIRALSLPLTPIRPSPLSPDLLERSVTQSSNTPHLPAPSSPLFASLPQPSPISVVGTPELCPWSPSPINWLPPDSPIDYEAAAHRVEFYKAQRLEQEHVAALRPPSPPVDQENLAPIPVPRPPSCLHATGQHPHQCIAVHTPQGEEWHPIVESYQGSIHNITTVQELSTPPPHFPSVFPFRSSTIHCLTILPHHPVTLSIGAIPLFACSQAVLNLPSGDLPLGWIKYNFCQGIKRVFNHLPLWYRQAYTHAIVVLKVQDFLDGQLVTTYSYLLFEEDRIFIVGQGYHFKDIVRSNSHLLAHTLSPRIPTDPFDFVSVHPDDQPL